MHFPESREAMSQKAKHAGGAGKASVTRNSNRRFRLNLARGKVPASVKTPSVLPTRAWVTQSLQIRGGR
jgi:hypothetical protein